MNALTFTTNNIDHQYGMQHVGVVTCTDVSIPHIVRPSVLLTLLNRCAAVLVRTNQQLYFSRFLNIFEYF